MKKKILIIVGIVLFVAAAVTGAILIINSLKGDVSVNGNLESEIDEEKKLITVEYNSFEFDTKDIKIGDSEFKIYADEKCKTEIDAKVSLKEGKNIFYLKVDGEDEVWTLVVNYKFKATKTSQIISWQKEYKVGDVYVPGYLSYYDEDAEESTKVEITLSMITGFDTSKEGKKTVSVKYKDFKIDLEINVKPLFVNTKTPLTYDEMIELVVIGAAISNGENLENFDDAIEELVSMTQLELKDSYVENIFKISYDIVKEIGLTSSDAAKIKGEIKKIVEYVYDNLDEYEELTIYELILKIALDETVSNSIKTVFDIISSDQIAYTFKNIYEALYLNVDESYISNFDITFEEYNALLKDAVSKEEYEKYISLYGNILVTEWLSDPFFEDVFYHNEIVTALSVGELSNHLNTYLTILDYITSLSSAERAEIKSLIESAYNEEFGPQLISGGLKYFKGLVDKVGLQNIKQYYTNVLNSNLLEDKYDKIQQAEGLLILEQGYPCLELVYELISKIKDKDVEILYDIAETAFELFDMGNESKALKEAVKAGVIIADYLCPILNGMKKEDLSNIYNSIAFVLNEYGLYVGYSDIEYIVTVIKSFEAYEYESLTDENIETLRNLVVGVYDYFSDGYFQALRINLNDIPVIKQNSKVSSLKDELNSCCGINYYKLDRSTGNSNSNRIDAYDLTYNGFDSSKPGINVMSVSYEGATTYIYYWVEPTKVDTAYLRPLLDSFENYTYFVHEGESKVVLNDDYYHYTERLEIYDTLTHEVYRVSIPVLNDLSEVIGFDSSTVGVKAGYYTVEHEILGNVIVPITYYVFDETPTITDRGIYSNGECYPTGYSEDISYTIYTEYDYDYHFIKEDNNWKASWGNRNYEERTLPNSYFDFTKEGYQSVEVDIDGKKYQVSIYVVPEDEYYTIDYFSIRNYDISKGFDPSDEDDYYFYTNYEYGTYELYQELVEKTNLRIEVEPESYSDGYQYVGVFVYQYGKLVYSGTSWTDVDVYGDFYKATDIEFVFKSSYNLWQYMDKEDFFNQLEYITFYVDGQFVVIDEPTTIMSKFSYYSDYSEIEVYTYQNYDWFSKTYYYN